MVKIKKIFGLIGSIITLIMLIHLIFYSVARQQAVVYIEKKYVDKNMRVGWPSQNFFNDISDGWYKVPVYTENKKQKIKFYVDLNMFEDIRDDDFLFWALLADAEEQFNTKVRETLPTAKVHVLHQSIDEKTYYSEFGKENIQYVPNSNGDLVLVVHIGWEENIKLSKEDFAEKCSEVGVHFLSAYPVSKLQFSYTYQEKENMYTTTEISRENLEKFSKDDLYKELYTNVYLY
ncbi:hypothetical protein [Paenibacillus sp. 1781tsa1]|uniref:hypothetical protein n=1 Tax=Paenibacillus sp. 1781tsa1 TaxID=2953810 RepID=UPI00209EBAA9|nr:hypothetical protein [Paenibacillus sp. 1781tsa1]MCP1182909.1 hypothetical protein [Paenibacillus sp. 1781tsa1]